MPKDKNVESIKKSSKNIMRTQAKSAEKEINQEIRDILEIFKSANKALNSTTQNFENSKNSISKFGTVDKK